MKSLIMQSLSVLLVLSFAAACGKKGGAGGGSNSSHVNNPITGVSSGDAAYTALKNWHTGSGEASVVGLHAYYLKESVSNSGFNLTTSMCLQNTNGIGCKEPNGCFKHTNAGVQVGSVVVKSDTFLGITYKKYQDCDITVTFNIYQKSQNAALSLAVNGDSSNGKYLIKSLTQQTGSIFKVFYGSFDGATSPTSYAIINTSLPSIVNPTEVGSVVTGPTEKLKDFRQAY